MTSALDEVGGQLHASAIFTPGKDPVPIAQEARCVPEPDCTKAEYLATTGIRSLYPTDLAIRYTDWAITAPYLKVSCT
jgi:hypothetical protein